MGDVYVSGIFHLYLLKCRFTQNYAKQHGGGFIIGGQVTRKYRSFYLQDCEFKKNIAGAHGEAFLTENHKMYFDDVDFNKNEYRMVPQAAGATGANLVYVIDR